MPRIPVSDRRAALVQAALRVIAREGVAAATTRAITAEADMPLASFHYAFRSRDELISELIRYVVEGEASAALTIGPDLRTTIAQGLKGFAELVRSDPLREQAMLELTLYAVRTPELGDAAQQQYASYYRAAAQIIEAVTQSLGVQWDRPIEEIARLLITFTDGITLDLLVNRDPKAVERTIEFAAAALTCLATQQKRPS